MAKNIGECLGVVSIVELASIARGKKSGELLDNQDPELEAADFKVKFNL